MSTDLYHVKFRWLFVLKHEGNQAFRKEAALTRNQVLFEKIVVSPYQIVSGALNQQSELEVVCARSSLLTVPLLV